MLTRDMKALYSGIKQKYRRLSPDPTKRLAYGVLGVSLSFFAVSAIFQAVRKSKRGRKAPVRPFGMSYISSKERDRRYGPLVFEPDPTASNPERVALLSRPNTVRVATPELAHVGRSYVEMHPDAGRALQRVLRDLKRDGKLGLIKTFSGTFNPRLVRGSNTTLSSHSYGTSIDLNAPQNPLYSPGTPEQWELAEYFIPHGFYWGGWFSRSDPHHFEWIGKPSSAAAA